MDVQRLSAMSQSPEKCNQRLAVRRLDLPRAPMLAGRKLGRALTLTTRGRSASRSSIHERQDLASGIPVPNSHVLVNGQSNNARQMALACFSNQPGEIQYIRADKGCVNAGLDRHILHSLRSRQWFP